MEEIIHFSEDKLPPLQFANFQGKLKRYKQIQHQGQKSAPTGVYTVFESLQDEYVVKNLDLDLGSLNQFIDLRSTDPNPVLPNLRLHNKNKKTKKEIKDNEHELFIKKVNVQQVQLTPFEVLKYEEDEKKRGQAAKDIVHMIFRKIYGEDIEKFEEKNSRQILQQKYLDGGGDDADDPKLKFIKKHSKKSLPERFEIFEKQMNQSKTQPQLKLKMVQPLEHQNSKVGKPKQGESAAKQKSEKSSDDRSPQSYERKISEIQGTKKSSDITLVPPKNQKKSFFGANFTDLIEEEPVQDQTKVKQKRLEILFKLKAQNTEVNSLWASYWGNNRGLLHIKEYIEIQKDQNQDIAKFFSHYEKFQNKFRVHIQNEFKEEIKDSTEEIVIIDPGLMIVLRNVEVTQEMVLWLAINTGHWGGVKYLEFYNTKLNEPSLKILITIVNKECDKIVSLNLSKNRLPKSIGKIFSDTLMKQKKLSRLRLNNVGMNTKEFVEICLAICEVEIRDIDFSENAIDKRGLKALETLLRYVKSLNSVDLSGNQFTEDNEEGKANLFRQLRKIIIYNAGLKNKNIKI